MLAFRALVSASTPSRASVAKTIRRLLRERGAGKTICPSEVARAIDSDDFRRYMPLVRSVASALVLGGEVVALQKGKPVSLETARGPIRLAAASERAGSA